MSGLQGEAPAALYHITACALDATQDPQNSAAAGERRRWRARIHCLAPPLAASRHLRIDPSPHVAPVGAMQSARVSAPLSAPCGRRVARAVAAAGVGAIAPAPPPPLSCPQHRPVSFPSRLSRTRMHSAAASQPRRPVAASAPTLRPRPSRSRAPSASPPSSPPHLSRAHIVKFAVDTGFSEWEVTALFHRFKTLQRLCGHPRGIGACLFGFLRCVYLHVCVCFVTAP